MNKNYFLLLFFSVLTSSVFGQVAPLIQVTVPIPTPLCDSTLTTNLTANYVIPKSTNTYTALPLDPVFNPTFPTTGGIMLNATADDVWSPVFNLPFSFAFYGGFYNQVIIGSNGLMSFNVGAAGGYCPWPFTATVPSASIPTNSIFGVYQDTNIQAPPVTNPAVQNVNYYVLDTGVNVAPNRVFVVNFNQLPQFSCNNSVGLQTSQIVIHEGSNIIDFFVFNRTCCPGWNSGSGVIGIQNNAGTQGTVAPGYNTGCWSITNDHFQITPSGPNVPVSLQWYEGGTPVTNGIPIGGVAIGAPNTNPVNAGPGDYTAVVTYTNPNGSTIVVSATQNVPVANYPLLEPEDIVVCTTTFPYNFDLYQSDVMTSLVSNPGDYVIKYYDNLIAAENDFPTNIAETVDGGGVSHVYYPYSGPFPKSIFVRVQTLAGADCYYVKEFVLDVGCGCTVTASSTSQTLCVNTPLTAMTFTDANVTAGSIIAGALPPGVTGNFNSLTETYTVSGTPTTPGLYSFTVELVNPLGNCTKVCIITVGAANTITWTASSGSENQTICLGNAITPIIYTYTGSATGATVTGLPASMYTVNTATSTVTISGTPPTNTPLNYTVTTTGGNCPAVNDTGSIAFTPNDTLALVGANNNQTICQGASITAITYNFTGGAPATVTGLPASMYTINNAAQTVTISGIPPGSTTLNYSIVTTGCTPVTKSGSISFSPNDTLALVGSNNVQTICQGSAIATITYNFTGGAPVTVTGLPAAMYTINNAGQTVTISGIPPGSTTLNYSIVTTGCNPVTKTGTINFTPNDTLSLASGSNAQNVCSGSAIAPITYNFTSSGATAPDVTGLPAGITFSSTATSLTISGTAATGTYNYTVNTHGCNPQTANGTITVAAAHTLVHVASSGNENQAICLGDAIVPISFTFGGGATGATVAGLPASLASNVSGNTLTISGTPSTNSVINYTVITTDALGCTAATLTGSITFNANDSLALAAGSNNAQTICQGAAITPIVYNFSSSNSNLTFTGLPPEIVPVITATSVTLSGTPSGTATINYTILTNGCNPVPVSGSIAINPADTLVHDPLSGNENQAICLGDTIIPIKYTFGGGATGINVSGLPAEMIAVITGNTVTISGTPASSTTINFTVTTSNAMSCPTVQLTGSITINPNDALTYRAGSGAKSQTICAGDAIVPIVFDFVSSTSNMTFTGLPASIVPVVDATLQTITLSGTPVASGPIVYTITTNGCNPITQGGTITINPLDTLVLNAGSDNAQTICLGNPIAPISYTFGGGATGVIAVGGLPAGLNLGTVGNVVTISGTPATNSPINYVLETTNSTLCPPVQVSGTILFNANDTLTYQVGSGAKNQTVCAGSAIVPIVFNYSSVNSTITISGLPVTMTAAITATTITISGSPATAGTINYSIDTNGCNVVGDGGIITVNAQDTLVYDASSGGTTQNICVGDAIIPIVYTFGGGANGVTVTGLPAAMTAVVSGNTVTISGTPTTNTAINYTVTTTNVTSCPAVSLTGTITFRQPSTLALTSASANANLCIDVAYSSNPIKYTFGGSATSAVFTNLPPGITATTSGNTITLSGSPTTPGTFNYTVSTQGGCAPNASATGSIVINPAVTLTVSSATQTVCIGAAITPVVYTYGSGATSASIVSGAFPAGLTAAAGANNTFTISGTPTAAGTFNVDVKTNGGCSSVTLTTQIIVTGPSTLTLQSVAGTIAQSVCINTAIENIVYLPGGSATQAALLASTPLPAGVTWQMTPTGLVISGTPTQSGTFPYTVVATNGCTSPSLSGVITVRALAKINLVTPGTGSPAACIGQENILIDYAVSSGATGATVTGLPAGVSGIFNAATNTFSIGGIPTQAGSFTYTVETVGGCPKDSRTGTITVDPLPVIVLPIGLSICIDEFGVPLSGAEVELTTGLPNNNYTFEWSNTAGVIAGATSNSYFAPAPGNYSVTVTNNLTGCSDALSTVVNTSLPPQQVIANVSDYFADDTVITVQVLPVGSYLYQLDGGAWQSNNQFLNVGSGYHDINVKDIGNCDERMVTVRIIDYPRFFTPNGDGYNDTWNIPDLSDQEASKIEIYDRYGKLIKEISPQGKGWDGFMNGKTLPSTDYWFKVYFNEQGASRIFRSHFSLKR